MRDLCSMFVNEDDVANDDDIIYIWIVGFANDCCVAMLSCLLSAKQRVERPLLSSIFLPHRQKEQFVTAVCHFVHFPRNFRG